MQQSKPTAKISYNVGPPENAEQRLMLGRITSQCFNADLENWHTYVQRLGANNFRVIRHQSRVVGGLGLYPMGQWFGGQSVPIMGIAAVGIAPDCRGRGAAMALLSQTLQDFYEQDIPLATLYASTSRLYRRVGFEQAGSLCRYSVPLSQIAPDRGTLPTPISPQEQATLAELYRQQARLNTGNLDRSDTIWQSILEDKDKPIYAYLFGPLTAPEGYVVFTQRSTPDDEGYHLEIRDRVSLTAAATQCFWTLMADHRSLAERLFWYGPPVDPLLSALEEQIYRVEHLERWLLRIVNVPRALSLRGYPAGIAAELHLEVDDPLLAANTGCLTLQIAAGQGQVTRGGRGDLKVGIRGLAALYSGFLTATQLQQLGWAAGTRDAIALANTIFATSAPWMSDHF